MGAQFLEFSETAEEMVNSRHYQGKVAHLSYPQPKFFGGGCSLDKQSADVCCPGNELVLGKGNPEAPEIKIQT